MMQSAEWVVAAVGAACVMRHLSHAAFYGTGRTSHLIELSAGWRSRVWKIIDRYRDARAAPR